MIAARRALALALLGFASAAHADPVAIVNAGFEAPYQSMDVPTGAFPTGPAPTGWQSYFAGATTDLFLGVLNPGTAQDYADAMSSNDPCFPDGAPEGDNVALLFTNNDTGGDEYGIRQVLGSDLAPDTTYTVTVEVGNIQTCGGLVAPYLQSFTLDGFPGYRVQLLAGGSLLEEDTGAVSPGEGLFETTSFQYTSGATVAPGQALEIRLISRNLPDVVGVDALEVDFDDVRLDAAPAASVPIPGAAVGGVLFALAASAARALRRTR